MQIQRTCNEKKQVFEYMTLMLTSGESTDRRGDKMELGNHNSKRYKYFKNLQQAQIKQPNGCNGT
jgi:hypothetical protein